MNKEIWVAGYPSYFGGADTELLNNIYLWKDHNVDVHLVPMFGFEPRLATILQSLGCTTHDYRPDIFRGKVVVSFCNGEFLRLLPEITEKGKPARVIWFNCMTWTFPNELTAQENGWIDLYGFVSSYQASLLRPQLEAHGKIHEFEGYRPYFNASSVEFNYKAPDKWFSCGRISRDDMQKYPEDMWNIFYKICVPKHKKIFILGYGPNASIKTGKPPNGLDWQTWGPNEIPVKQIYQLLHCIIHKTGGSRESYCRIVPEAFAYGVPIITEDDYAFPDLIDNGVTGYRCKTSDEMSFRASELAFDEEKRKKMIYSARKFLENEIASSDRCWKPWEQVL